MLLCSQIHVNNNKKRYTPDLEIKQDRLRIQDTGYITYTHVMGHVVEDVGLQCNLLPSDNGVRKVQADEERSEGLNLKD